MGAPFSGNRRRQFDNMFPMICISIAQESRRLALADMLNAAQMGADLLEVRLDCFENQAEPKELLQARRKPVIFSCRRREDGGGWSGSEEERVMLLKKAIISDADYCELEQDIADQVRRFGPCQRVVSYTNLGETPADIGDIYESLQRKQADVIKLTCKARTPEEAWPLVQLLAKAKTPTVVVGLGRPGLMLTILGRKFGAPWTVAALEKGVEAYPGQPTIRELDSVYHYRSIHRQTKLVGVTGVGEREYVTTALLNTAFAHLDQPIRCLPLQVGNVRLFRKAIDLLKLSGVVIEAEQQEALRELAEHVDESVAAAALNPGGMPVENPVDLLCRDGKERWLGRHTFGIAVAAALEDSLRRAGKQLEGAVVLLAGLNATAQSIARAVKERGGILIFAGRDRDVSARFSRMFGGRQIQHEAIYSTLHDVTVVSEGELHPGFLKAGMTVIDVTALPRKTALMRAAEERGCGIVAPADLLIEQVRRQVKCLTGEEAARAPLEALMPQLLDDE